MKPVAIFRHAAIEGPGLFAEFLDERNIPWTLIAIDAGDPLPVSAAAYSGLVFMGGPMSVNDDLPWIPGACALIREAAELGIPLLGHCLGAQLMSKALGGVVSKNRAPLPQAGEGEDASLRELQVKEIGWGEVRVSSGEVAHSWFGDINRFDAFHWHGETFSLPQGAVLLLSSAHCTNQAYALGPHLALQCHVEMTEPMIVQWCEAGAAEVADASGPAVQSVQQMLQQSALRLPQLNRVAQRLYARWVCGLLAP